MTDLFYTILNMSISASVLILAVLLLRLLFRKAPKWITVLLWGLVAVRLICPFALETPFSLMPKNEWITEESTYNEDNQYFDSVPPDRISGDSIIGNDINVEYYESPLEPHIEINRGVSLTFVLNCVWLAGVGIMFVYMLVSYICVYRRIHGAKHFKDNIYTSEAVASPFVFGLIRPRIYLPENMDAISMSYVIAHEEAHLRRFDHLWKPFGFLLLAIHWFNPLIWLGYILLCRDIEMACDERVVRGMNDEERVDYSEALLECSVSRKLITACPLAFGEVGAKERIKTVLSYKKPAFWIVAVAVIACIAVAVCFLTNPQSKADAPDGSYTLEIYYDLDYELTAPLKESNNVKVVIDDLMNVWVYDGEQLMSGGLYKEIKLNAINFDVLFENTAIDIGLVMDLRKDCSASWVMTYTTSENGHHPYLVLVDRNEQVYLAVADYISGTPKRISGVFKLHKNVPEQSVITPDTGKSSLTLEDVITLSAKGTDLTWEDFVPYACRDVGSGLYICRYEIDDIFHLLVGDGKLTGTPMYIRLKLNDGDAYADVTKDDIAAFIREHISVKISVDSSISVPQPVLDYALSILQSHIDTYNGYGESQKAVTRTTYTITEAKIMSISRFNTGTAGLSDACYLYKMECLLKPTETDPANIFLAGGMLLEDGWFKIVQPYFAMYQSWSEGEDTWKPMGVIDELTIATEYGTDEMLAKYGNMYTAALMEMLGSFEGRSRQSITIAEISKDANMVLEDRRYILDENEYTRYILVSITEHSVNEKFTNVRLISMTLGENGMEPDQVHYTFPELTHEKPLLIGVVFYGDMTTYGLMFTDENGNEYGYMVYESGKDGSVCLQQMN